MHAKVRLPIGRIGIFFLAVEYITNLFSRGPILDQPAANHLHLGDKWENFIYKYTTLFGTVENGCSHYFKFAEISSKFCNILYITMSKIID